VFAVFSVLFMLLYVVAMILTGNQPDTNRKYVATLFCLLETTETGTELSPASAVVDTKKRALDSLLISHDSDSLGSSGYLNAVVRNKRK